MLDYYSELCSEETLYYAWLKVEANNGCAGFDDESIEDFERDLERNILSIAYQLENELYSPSPLKSVAIPKDNGKFRKLGIPTIRDRIVFQAVNVQLQFMWDPYFSPLSFAYRPGKSVGKAIGQVKNFLNQGRRWYIKGDIQGCFDSLSWDLMSISLRQNIQDERLLKLINKAVRVPYVKGNVIYERNKGIPQGSPLSPILANLYLHDFDIAMADRGYNMVRYGDDWLALVYSEDEAEEGFYAALDILSELRIEISEGKSGIGNLDKETITFLGYSINAKEVSPSAKAWHSFSEAIDDLGRARNNREYQLAKARLMHLKAQYNRSGSMQ